MNTAPAVQQATTVAETAERMLARLEGMVSEAEIREKAELAFAINRLKLERNAIILGHNYMEPALYCSVPDYVGDSLELSRISAKTDAAIIVFCGVSFMAETAKVLSPDKTVLVPAEDAGCSLAEGITPDDVKRLKAAFPGAPVVTYVNTFAEVKAESDYCCTSGNSSAVMRHVLDEGHDKVIFVPDEYLGRNTASELGIPFVAGWEDDAPAQAAAVDSAIIGWRAQCEVHEEFTVEDVKRARKEYPDALLIAHPECSPPVMELIDVSGSTKTMVECVQKMTAPCYVLLTESSMAENLAVTFPEARFGRVGDHRCPYMELITLEQTLEAIQKTQYAVELSESVVERAKLPIDRMLSIR